jgi:hypothetical protein
MSSSSSLQAARRRRAGVPGGQPPVSGPPGRVQQSSQSNKQVSSPSIPPNPLMILQQHHAKIIMLDQQVQKLISDKESYHLEEESSNENIPIQQKFDLNEVTDLLLSRIENKIDLKAFYDNDQQLASEIENLNKIIIQQQSTLNHLNKLLYFIIGNLKLDFNQNQDIEKLDENENINLEIKDNLENHLEDSMNTQDPTFPRSVKINLNNTETIEYTPFEEHDDESIYNPNMENTESELPVPTC